MRKKAYSTTRRMPSRTCPPSPWEVLDALDKVRLQIDNILYMEIED